jgi:hypothetical protein
MNTTTEKTIAQKLNELGLLQDIMWHERYKEDRPGEFQRDRSRLENESVEEVFDRWLRGHNIMGYAGTIMSVLDDIRKVVKE